MRPQPGGGAGESFPAGLPAVAAASAETGNPAPALTEKGEGAPSPGEPLGGEVIPSQETHGRQIRWRPRTIILAFRLRPESFRVI